jgi:hypothetical protein
LGPLGTAATNKPVVPAPGDYDDGEFDGMIGRGNRSTQRKSAQYRFVHHKPHMLPGANTGRRVGKPETNRLSYGTASGLSYALYYEWRDYERHNYRYWNLLCKHKPYQLYQNLVRKLIYENKQRKVH